MSSERHIGSTAWIARAARVMFAVCLLMFSPLLASSPAAAQTAPLPRHVAIDILAEKQAVAPGSEIWIALRERIEPGWHTYWTNPGVSGEPTTLTWRLPAGFETGPVLFPIPSTIPVGPLVNYGYSNEVLLLSRLKVSKDAKAGPLDIRAIAEWLVCKDICVPETGEARLTVTVAGPAIGTAPGPDARRLTDAAAALPAPLVSPVRFAVAADTIDLTFAGFGKAFDVTSGRPVAVTFFPETWGHVNHAGAQTLTWTGDDLTLHLERGDLKKEALPGLTGLLVVERAGGDKGLQRRGFSLVAGAPATKTAALAPGGEQSTAGFGKSAATPLGAPPADDTSLLKALLFAVLGGLILNLMPCVFPVLALKAVALARQDRPRSERRTDGLAYLAGVLVSFAVMAIALLALRQAGQSFGWGFQFQSPVFVLLMAGLFFSLGLSLSGVLTVGGSLAGAGEALARKSGPAGTFFTGALATIAATPCTAPFMGAAVGYAVSAPAFAGFLVLMAMGLGFAAPVVALAVAPGLQRLLPRPGRWMETFKQVMAFPLYASAAWMVWVLSVQTGSDGVLAAMVLLIGLAFLAWLWTWTQTWTQAGQRAISAALFAVAVFAVVSISARQIVSASAPAGSASLPLGATDITGLPIIPFSTGRIAALQQKGRPVFVNVTAAWCITCKVNEKVALSSERMHAAFTASNVAYVKGDWTRQDPAITSFLRGFGRAGVPLYLFYPGRPGAPPRVLGQVLTEKSVLAEMQAALAGG